jgi:O-methyltransferase
MRPRELLKEVLPPFLVTRLRRPLKLPDAAAYRSWLRYERRYSPWFEDAAFVSAYDATRHLTMIDVERAWILWSLVRQTIALGGDFMEAGVYRGGSALLLWQAMRSASDRQLHLFDSFVGLPAPGNRDVLRQGDMSATSFDAVKGLFGDPRVQIHAGWIPATFEATAIPSIAFAHVDVDLERSVLDATAFIYPRLQPGGVVVFDDYGLTCCPGARSAVDDFFRERPESPLVLPTGQAVVIKLPS